MADGMASGTDHEQNPSVDEGTGPDALADVTPSPDRAGPSLARMLNEAAVRVRASGCGRLGTGSGFAIADDVVVTNRHVAADADELQLSTWDGQSFGVASVSLSLRQDLALLHLDDGVLPHVADLAPHDPTPGTSVQVVGYPQGGQVKFEQTRVVDYVDGPRLGVPGNAMRLTGAVEPGNSGGPVIDDAGRVVGVVYGVEKATGYGLATPVSAVRTLRERATDRGVTPAC